MSKHTPGPWSVEGDKQTMIGAADGKMMVAQTLHDHICKEWSRPLAEAQANAKLIAAAPELLKRARAFVDSVRSMPQDYDLGTKEHGLAVSLNTRYGELLEEIVAKLTLEDRA